jgi:hypothetical protein
MKKILQLVTIFMLISSNIKIYSSETDQENLEKELYKAITRNDLNKIQDYIEKGANLHEPKEPDYLPPLHHAVDCDNPEALQILLAHRANPHHPYSSSIGSPLDLTVRRSGRNSDPKYKKKHKQIVHLLINIAGVFPRYDTVVNYSENLLEMVQDIPASDNTPASQIPLQWKNSFQAYLACILPEMSNQAGSLTLEELEQAEAFGRQVLQRNYKADLALKRKNNNPSLRRSF